MSLIDTKSLLAKLMATEDLHIEQKNCETASFNVKTRVLTIPILGKDVPAYTYDLFMGHEVGHALYTPFESVKKAVEDAKKAKIPEDLFIGLLNIVEDSRIERKIKYKYPGLRHSFVKAYNDLYTQDFFGTEGQDLNEQNLPDRINLHQKVGARLNIQFTDTERDLLNDVENTETYEDVVEVSRKLYEHIKQEMEQKLKEEEQKPKNIKIIIKNSDGEEDGEMPEMNEPFEGKVEVEFAEDFDPSKLEGQSDKKDGVELDIPDIPKTGNEKSDGEEAGEQQSEENSSGEGEGTEDEKVKSFGEKLEEALKEAARAYTDENYKSNESKLFDEKANDYVYVNVPKFDLDKAVMDHKLFYKLYKEDGNCKIDVENFNKIRKESNKVVSYLVKEFELRKNAEQSKRASISKTGELNMSKVYSYNFSEDIFKKMTIMPQGKSHGLVMFLDWSGSMTNHIENTVKQLISLVLFCKKVNIPYDVYAFADDTTHEKTAHQIGQKKNDLVMRSVSLVNLLSSRMSAAEFTYAASALVFMSTKRNPYWFSMNGTPLNETIVCAMEIVPEFQKRNRLQIVNTVFLTDGESNSTNEYFTGDTSGYTHRERNYIGSNMVVLRDPVTRYEERFSYNGTGMTKALIKLLRHRTKSHVVGFYVISNREFNNVSHRWFGNNIISAKEAFRKNRFVVLDNSGFDEYYFLRSNKNEDGEVEFEVDEGITKRSLVTAFSRHAGNKIQSRTVLTRFIQMIS